MSSNTSSESFALDGHFLPKEPLHPQGAAFFEKVTGMLDGQAKDDAVVVEALSGWDGVLEKVASELYRIGSMLVGSGEDSVALIEHVVINLDLSSCRDHTDARHQSRLALGAQAIEILERRKPSSFTVPDAELEGPVSCIEDDDLESVGMTGPQLEAMLNGPDDQHLRTWLEGLDLPLRVIFVLRAIAALSSVEVAVLLTDHGGPAAQDWHPEAVRTGFRQALCSLASQLIHASVTK